MGMGFRGRTGDDESPGVQMGSVSTEGSEKAFLMLAELVDTHHRSLSATDLPDCIVNEATIRFYQRILDNTFPLQSPVMDSMSKTLEALLKPAKG